MENLLRMMIAQSQPPQACSADALFNVRCCLPRPDSPHHCKINVEIDLAVPLDRDEASRAKHGNDDSENCRALPGVEHAHRLGALARIRPVIGANENRFTVPKTPNSRDCI